MTNELDVFRSLCRTYVAGYLDIRFMEDENWTSQFFKREILAVKELINLRAYQYESSKDRLTSYIRFVEKALIKLGAEIIAYGQSFALFLAAIDEILEFLISEFRQCFDFDLVATTSYKAKVIFL